MKLIILGDDPQVFAKPKLPEESDPVTPSIQLANKHLWKDGCAVRAIVPPGVHQCRNGLGDSAGGGGVAQSKYKKYRNSSKDGSHVSEEEFTRGMIGYTTMPLLPEHSWTSGYHYRKAPFSSDTLTTFFARSRSKKRKERDLKSTSRSELAATRKVRYKYGRRARRRRFMCDSANGGITPAFSVKMSSVHLALFVGGRRFSRRPRQKRVRAIPLLKTVAEAVSVLLIQSLASIFQSAAPTAPDSHHKHDACEPKFNGAKKKNPDSAPSAAIHKGIAIFIYQLLPLFLIILLKNIHKTFHRLFQKLKIESLFLYAQGSFGLRSLSKLH